MIPFNRPYLTGKEIHYIQEVLTARKLSGDGSFTKQCHQIFQEKFGFRRSLLTTSCTAALEMTAILLDIEPGDEVILPSYTFSSTANAFALRGAKLIFVDSREDEPNIDAEKIAAAVTPRTRAIVVVHYAGVACDMDAIQQIAFSAGIPIIEDAAQAIDSYYRGRALGTFGAFSTFSFHETKNISSGEGGLLVINDEKYDLRAEIIREKGTNRSAFFRNEVDKYGWVDVGSSYLPSDILAAFLFAQLQELDKIQAERLRVWHRYAHNLQFGAEQGWFSLPFIPDYATNNAHMFYLICHNLNERIALMNTLKEQKIFPTFHYLSLHNSPYYVDKHDGPLLVNSDRYTDTLLRLPLFVELDDDSIDKISDLILKHFKK
ncbi:MAG: dTDP-4-amino-4,6-dideoxygalactose transaminase [Legionellales bacterium]|nr:dTDP-4-amino-4,6-dideoxygalactose transaminase [Legionellales bacterium]